MAASNIESGPHLAEFAIITGSECEAWLRTCMMQAQPFEFGRLGRPELDQLDGEWYVLKITTRRDEARGELVRTTVNAERLTALPSVLDFADHAAASNP